MFEVRRGLRPRVANGHCLSIILNGLITTVRGPDGHTYRIIFEYYVFLDGIATISRLYGIVKTLMCLVDKAADTEGIYVYLRQDIAV